jgi:hypothetical protein
LAYEETQFLCLYITKFIYFYLIVFIKISNWELLALIGSGLLSLYLFFYQQFNSNFAVLFGDPYDGVIEAVLTGHWYKVAGLAHHWNQAFFFYPHEDTLGYNDSYLIYGVLASIFQ